jgi:DNA modification methylase
MMMMMMMRDSGLECRHNIVWKKNAPTFSMGRLDYDYKHEPIMLTWFGKHKFYGKGDQKTSVWEYNKPLKCDLHPTMKPIELIVNAILNNSDINDVVFDAFLGSGSTLIASEKTDRICYGIELDEHYIDVIVKRWLKFMEDNNREIKSVKLNGKDYDYNEILND